MMKETTGKKRIHKIIKLSKEGYIVICAFIIICLLVFLSVYLYYSGSFSKYKDVKLSENMIKNKSYDGLVITDIKANQINKENHIIFTIKNNTNSYYESKDTNIYFLDKDNNIVDKINISIPKIDKKNKGYIDVSVQKHVLKSDDFKLSD